MVIQLPWMGTTAPFFVEVLELTMEDIFCMIQPEEPQAEAAPSTTEGEGGELRMTIVEEADLDHGLEEVPSMEHPTT